MLRIADTRFVTSIGFAFGAPLAGLRVLFALLQRRFASASLHSGA